MKTKLNCILVIDDDEPTNFLNQMILEESGCTRYIKIVQSGQEALDYLSNSTGPGRVENQYPSPDLILLDINMPAMNGWEFLEEYEKRNQKHNKIVTIMLTTSLFLEDKIRIKEMPGISGFENKPLTIEKVEKIVNNYFVKDYIWSKLRANDIAQLRYR